MISANLVGHCAEGTSDKVYIAQVIREGPRWAVVGFGGRRNGMMSRYPKGTYGNLAVAISARDKLFASKVRSKNYVDVESPTYSGPVTLDSVRAHLAPDIEEKAESSIPSYIKKQAETAKVVRQHRRGAIVICKNSTGLSGINQEVEYVIWNPPDGEGMMAVLDNYGQPVEVSKDRFQLTDRVFDVVSAM